MGWLRTAATLLFALGLLTACRSPRPEIAPPATADKAAVEGSASHALADVEARGALRPEPTDVPAPPPEFVPAPPPAFAPAATESRPATPPLSADLPAGAAGDLARYGLAIIDDTPAKLMPQREAESRGPSGGRLSCRHCHLDGGRREDAFPWLGTAAAYPRYEPRSGRVVSVEDQVNACVVRCVNAPPLPATSREMRAIVAYLQALPPRPSPAAALPPFPLPERPADLAAGEEVYRNLCQRCHSADGAGGAAGPPLWGAGSYATGAPMHRVLTAAAFIRAQMPPGGELSAGQAFDVAAYVNSFTRPATPGLHLDYPALTEKPIDCPYPPFPDHFPAHRHRYGPFADMEELPATGRKAE